MPQKEWWDYPAVWCRSLRKGYGSKWRIAMNYPTQTSTFVDVIGNMAGEFGSDEGPERREPSSSSMSYCTVFSTVMWSCKKLSSASNLHSPAKGVIIRTPLVSAMVSSSKSIEAIYIIHEYRGSKPSSNLLRRTWSVCLIRFAWSYESGKWTGAVSFCGAARPLNFCRMLSLGNI